MYQEYIILQICAIKFICKFLIFFTSEFNLKIIPSFFWEKASFLLISSYFSYT